MSERRVKIVLRKNTEQAWIAENPVLLSGEPGFSTTTGILKIGDGQSTWANLPPINTDNSIITDIDTVYRIVKDEELNRWYLQAKTTQEEEYITVSIIDLTNLLNEKADIADLENKANIEDLEAKIDASELANVAFSGNINDIIQLDNDPLIFNCGTSTTVIS